MILTLPLDMTGRRFRVGDDCGDVFEVDDDFDGLTLTLELKSQDEAKSVLAAILDQYDEMAMRKAVSA